MARVVELEDHIKLIPMNIRKAIINPDRNCGQCPSLNAEGKCDTAWDKYFVTLKISNPVAYVCNHFR